MEYVDILAGNENKQAVILYISDNINKAKKLNLVLKSKTPALYLTKRNFEHISGEETVYNQVIVFDKQGNFKFRKYLAKNLITNNKNKVDFISQY